MVREKNSSQWYSMKTKIIFLIMVSNIWFGDVIAMEFFRKISAVFEKKQEEDNASKIDKILLKNHISTKKHIQLALLCMENPGDCINKQLFSKIQQSSFTVDGNDFFYAMFLNINQRPEYRALLQEAFDNQAFNPHQKPEPGASDLALLIISSDDDLRTSLFGHPNFNPNQQYGEKKISLVTHLAKEKNYNSLVFIMKHPLFDPNSDANCPTRAGYYLLKNNEDEGINILRQLMGPDQSKWSLHGLGLTTSSHLDIFLRNIVDNNEDRLEVFKRIIKQYLISFEGRHSNQKVFAAVTKLLALNKKLGSKIYIDEVFTQGAIEALINFEVIKVALGHMSGSDGWFARNKQDLKLVDMNIFLSAAKKHREVLSEERECTICLSDEEKVWFSSTSFCDHSFCKNCWIKYCSDREVAGSHSMCLAKDCPFSIPPSAFCAVAAECLYSDDFEAIARGYHDCHLAHRRMREATLESVEGFRRCPNCQDTLLIDLKDNKARSIACPGCNKKFLVDLVANADPTLMNDFVDPSLCTNLGTCSNCGILIDKISGCTEVNCPRCRTVTYWVALK